jgi:hypothetical protein
MLGAWLAAKAETSGIGQLLNELKKILFPDQGKSKYKPALRRSPAQQPFRRRDVVNLDGFVELTRANANAIRKQN